MGGTLMVKADLLTRRRIETTTGDLRLETSLCFNPTLGRLTLAIFQLEGLTCYDGEDLPDLYVKVTVSQNMKVVKTKRTGLVRRNLQPAFNESFDLKLEEERGDLGKTILTLQLKQARIFAVKDLTLGSVVLGPAMFAKGSGLTQWEWAIANPKEKVVMQHTLMNSRSGFNSET